MWYDEGQHAISSAFRNTLAFLCYHFPRVECNELAALITSAFAGIMSACRTTDSIHQAFISVTAVSSTCRGSSPRGFREALASLDMLMEPELREVRLP